MKIWSNAYTTNDDDSQRELRETTTAAAAPPAASWKFMTRHRQQQHPWLQRGCEWMAKNFHRENLSFNLSQYIKYLRWLRSLLTSLFIFSVESLYIPPLSLELFPYHKNVSCREEGGNGMERNLWRTRRWNGNLSRGKAHIINLSPFWARRKLIFSSHWFIP